MREPEESTQPGGWEGQRRPAGLEQNEQGGRVAPDKAREVVRAKAGGAKNAVQVCNLFTYLFNLSHYIIDLFLSRETLHFCILKCFIVNDTNKRHCVCVFYT